MLSDRIVHERVNSITVAIVEDNDDIREGLAVLINGSAGFRCIATCGSGEEALRTLPRQMPDVVLMDIRLPGMSGIECVEKLKGCLPDTQIMMLTVYEENDQIFSSIVAGATGYILKKTPPAELLEGIRDLVNGGSPMSDQIARKVVEAFKEMGKSSREIDNLTDREKQILEFLAKGFHDKEIAANFFLSPETVRTHLRNVYKKLHVRSRTEAVLKYLKR